MRKNEFKNLLVEFIKKGTCSYTCIKEIKTILNKNGFVELNESDNWEFIENKFYIIRNDASIIAFSLPKEKKESFFIITTHCDTPSLLLKPKGAYVKDNYLKYNIMPYGGLLNYGWLDHPLSLAGRMVIKEGNNLITKIVDFAKPMMIVPSVPIHLNDNANSNLDLNMQIDLQPIITLSKKTKSWEEIINKHGNVIDYDLYAYNFDNPSFIGQKDELLLSPRIDNLTSVYAGLNGFLNSNDDNIKVFCSFNNEEIGSLTVEGADSNFLLDNLKRVASYLKIDISSALASSIIVSSDNTHAIHPNHREYADDTGVLYLGEGLAIIKEMTSTTNAITSSIIKTICDQHKIKYQIATSKNDLAGGSTLSGLSLRHVSVLSIDVGVPELAMHSSLETCSIDDVFELYKMMKYFYGAEIIKTADKIAINTK